MKKILWIVVIFVVIAIMYFFTTQRAHAPVTEVVSGESTMTPPQEQEIDTETLEMIEVTTPLPNATITNSMILTGRARGPWYFEASFPIELRDANNVLITTVVAQAQGEWMTEDFVPFTATLTFPPQPAGSQGVLTFKNDNPSGEPERDMMFDVPVVF